MVSATTDRRLGLAGNTAFKTPVAAIATTNIVQSGEQTIDGYAVKAINAAGVPDRVLCVGMTDATKNGIWDVSTGSWTRSIDANGNYDVTQGTLVIVTNGASAFQVWMLTTAAPINFGSTALTYTQSFSLAFAINLASSANGSGADLVGGVGRVVNTIAALKALAKTGTGKAFVLGYYAAGDSGGGQFYYDSTDTTSSDNGGTIIVAADGGRWKRVYTGDLYDAWFGARVNGTDDSAFVQAMVNAATNPLQQICRLVKGTRILSNISLPSGVALIGSGKESCTINVTSTVNSVFLLNSFTKLGGLNFNYPNQAVSGSPTVYPSTITHAAAGCSYVDISGIRMVGAYDGIILGDSTHGCANINIDDVDGFPLHIGIKIDNCVDVVRITRTTFNYNITGSLYTGTNQILQWVFANGIGIRMLRCDSALIIAPLVYGYKRAITFEGGNPSGSANMMTVVAPIIDLCAAPVETINYQDGVTFLGGSMTSSQGYFGATGVAMPLAGGVAVNQCVKFVGTIFRNFYDGIADCSTNVDFIDCEFYNYNVHNAAAQGAITLKANNVTVRVKGGRIDGGSFSNSRGIDNQGAFTGTVMQVEGVTFSNMGSSTIFQPSKTLLLGPCAGLGAIFYNGITVTQNSQGLLMASVIPAAGTWIQDDRFDRSSAAVGSPKAWRCTVGGTPGTWVSEGNL